MKTKAKSKKSTKAKAASTPTSTEPPIAERFEQVPIGRLIENKHNPRKQFKRIDELAESIRCNGVIEPLVVREVTDGSDKKEIICGARRYRASKQAGLAVVPCIIRQLTDLQVALCMLEENANREDVHPLQEADGIAHAIELGGDVETVAAKMGREVPYVARRLQLQKLTKKARKLFEDETINVGHAMELARLPADQQDRLSDSIKPRWGGPVMSVKELRELIARDTLRPLDGARWKKDDAELLPKAGACTLCPKNTANATALFNDISSSKPHCTDPGCYEQKQERFVQLEVQRLREQGTPPAAITSHYDDRKLKKEFSDIRRDWSVKEITPKQAKTLKPEEVGRGIFVDGERAGETVLFKIDPDDARQDDGADRYKREQQAKQRKADRETAANFAVIDAMLPKVDGSTPVLVAIARAQFGRLMQDHQKLICKRRGWQKPAKQRDGGSGWMHHAVEAFLDLAKQQELLAFMVECALATSAKVSLWYHGDKDDLKRLTNLAKHLGVDAGEIRQRVIDEAKEKERAKGKSTKAKPAPAAKAKSKSGPAHRTCGSCGEYLEPEETELCSGCQPAAKPKKASKSDDGERACRVCGCTEDDCRQCIKKTGAPCWWVEADLCSACAPPEGAKISTGRADKPAATPNASAEATIIDDVADDQIDFSGGQKIDEDVLDVLRRSTIEGKLLRMPAGLERKLYLRVMKVVEILGGEWSRKAGAHVFPLDPTDQIAEVLRCGRVVDRKKVLGFFPTPPDLARELVALAQIEPGMEVLEPSRGDGSLVRAILAEEPKAVINAVEIDPAHMNALDGLNVHYQWQGDFLDFRKFHPGKFFDRIVCNPPFNRGVWLKHISEMLNLLAPGGRLVAILPAAAASPAMSLGKKMHAELARLPYLYHYRDVLGAPFASVGTKIEVVMLCVDRLATGSNPAPAPADDFDDDVQILTPAEAGIDLATLEGNDCQGQLETADGVPAIGSLEWSTGLWAVVGRQMVRGRNCWKLCALAKTSKKPVENTYRGAELAERARRGVFDGAVVQARKSWWVICDKPGNTPADQVFIADSAAGLAGAA